MILALPLNINSIAYSPRSIMDPEKPASNSTASKKGKQTSAAASAGSASECKGEASNAPRESAPSGLILKSGRVRLPDKLMEYLNKEASEALYWMPEGESFALNTETAQEQFLDKFFSGTKLSSFLRSISRWYVTSRKCHLLSFSPGRPLSSPILIIPSPLLKSTGASNESSIILLTRMFTLSTTLSSIEARLIWRRK